MFKIPIDDQNNNIYIIKTIIFGAYTLVACVYTCNPIGFGTLYVQFLLLLLFFFSFSRYDLREKHFLETSLTRTHWVTRARGLTESLVAFTRMQISSL